MAKRASAPGDGHRPTLADVAARAGLSKAAVSMILNDRPGSRLSAEAAEKVRAAAAELGYRPNPAARSLRLGTTHSMGLISDQVTITRYASAMVRGALRAAKEHDVSVLIAETGDETSLGEALEEMLHRRVDGVIIGLMAARLVDVPPAPEHVPVVIVNGRTPDDLPSVLPDEYTAGRAMAEVLLDAGHTRVGFIGDIPRVASDPRSSATIAHRVTGIREAFGERGVSLICVDLDAWEPEVGFTEMNRMLDAEPNLTAVIAATDGVAFGIYQALAERGLRVPDDVSVVSFDDEELAAMLRPGLTTARLPYEQMARHGVEMLLGARERTHELVPMPLILRGSVRDLR
ncbi:MAG: LacI family DNA-binding transcriptional regulator [Microbacterium sp.]